MIMVKITSYIIGNQWLFSCPASLFVTDGNGNPKLQGCIEGIYEKDPRRLDYSPLSY